MRAYVKTDLKKAELLELPIPQPRPGEIVVRTTLASICGTDLHLLDEYPNELIEGVYPGVVLPEGLPLGHEGVGVVHAVGDGVTRFQVGERVLAASTTSCGRCRDCLRGNHSLCTGGGAILLGAQGEYLRVPHAELSAARVPDAVDDRHALLVTDILSTGFAALERARCRVGDSVVIFGQGPVGVCAVAAARALGCGLLVAIDTVPERLAMAKRFGANVAIDAGREDAALRVLELTGGEGADVVVEAAGSPVSFEACTRSVRRGGSISVVGIFGLTPSVSMETLQPSFLHRDLVTTLCPTGRDRLERLLAWLEHAAPDFEALFTHEIPLAEIARAYDLFRNREQGVVKVAITP